MCVLHGQVLSVIGFLSVWKSCVVIIHFLEISWLFVSKDFFHADQISNYLSFVTISALESHKSVIVISFSIIYLILNRL